MLKILLPVILIALGGGAGIGAGLFLRPPPPEPEMTDAAEPAPVEEEEEPEEDTREYVKMNNQFVIPVVNEDRVAALVVMSLSLEVEQGQTQEVFSREPKLRDGFLQAMFDHANHGGFDGEFTGPERMGALRERLLASAEENMENAILDVLITEIARQDY